MQATLIARSVKLNIQLGLFVGLVLIKLKGITTRIKESGNGVIVDGSIQLKGHHLARHVVKF
jgi:hypothetical protein